MIKNYTKIIISMSIGLLLSSYAYATSNVPPVTQQTPPPTTTGNNNTGPTTNQMPSPTTLPPSTTDNPTDPNAINSQQENVNNSLKDLENKLKASQDSKTSGSNPTGQGPTSGTTTNQQTNQ